MAASRVQLVRQMGTTWRFDAVRAPRSSHGPQGDHRGGPAGTGRDRMRWTRPGREPQMRLRKKKSLIDQAGDYVDAVRPQFESAVAPAKEPARKKALPLHVDARDKAAPVLADAVDRAGTQLVEAREKAGPL